MTFLVKHTPWNKGKTYHHRPEVAEQSRENLKRYAIPANKHLFKKGHTPLNKGIARTDAVKLKIRLALRGRTAWNKGKTFNSIRGDKHWNWKGGSWASLRRMALNRDNHTCKSCNLYAPDIVQVDHVKPKSKFPELKLVLSNLTTLCPNCHSRKSNKEKCKGKGGRKLIIKLK